VQKPPKQQNPQMPMLNALNALRVFATERRSPRTV